MARIREIGFVRPLDDGRWEVRSPRLQRAAGELADLGVPLAVAVEIVGALRHHSEAVAKTYVDLFIDRVWRPFNEAGEPEERWDEVRQALDRLRPLAAETLLAVFGLVMTDQVEQALTRELATLSRREAS